MKHETSMIVAALLALSGLADAQLGDKTLVAWVAPANLTQRGGSVLTLDDGQGHFDGIVFGELAAGKWMAGSDNYRRTEKNQDAWQLETAGPDIYVQIAVVYRGTEVSTFRDGKVYSMHQVNAPQPFGQESIILIGPRHAGNNALFEGAIDDARIYDRALTAAEVSALRPNAEGAVKPWAWWTFDDAACVDRAGHFAARLTGGARVEGGRLLLDGKGAAFVAARNASDLERLCGPAMSGAVLEARRLRERFLADPYRPRYHFCVPEDMGVPGDPNGAFYANGRYHLMYLYNRTGSGFCWGHISSADLVHWRHHPDAIGPGDGDEGCFSGGAFVDDDGAAYLSYWMLWGAKGIGLAKSAGAGFDAWTKLGANPVIKSTEFGVTEVKDAAGNSSFLGSADPSNIWKKDGKYYLLAGNLLVLNKVGRAADAPLSEQGDRLYLFDSADLKTWNYRHVFLRAETRVDRPQRGQHVPQLPASAFEP